MNQVLPLSNHQKCRKEKEMLKRPSLIFLTTICCLLFSTHYVFALNIDYSQVLRDNIVHESGAFSGETDRDVMKASVQLSGVSNPNDYRVYA